jgi:hypothetical protein
VPPVVYCHIGPPKSGTTFLQAMLWQHRAALGRDGVLYPARHPNDHFRAALDLRGIKFQGYDDPRVPGAWQRVVDRSLRWRGRAAVISQEWLAAASEKQVDTAMASLRPAEVHIVYVARDLTRQVPAMWQELIKNGRVLSFPEYLRSLKAPKGPHALGRLFWRDQDAVRVLGRWGRAIPAHRVHVITAPRKGAPPALLWERFASVLSLDPARYSADVARPNRSLGAGEVELLRRVNRALGGRLAWPAYGAVVKDGFTPAVLGRRAAGTPIALPPRWQPWLLERAEHLVAGLRESGYDIVGNLDELINDEPVGPGESAPPGPPIESQLDVAADALATLLLTRSEDRGLLWRSRARAVPRWARETVQDLLIRRSAARAVTSRTER